MVEGVKRNPLHGVESVNMLAWIEPVLSRIHYMELKARTPGMGSGMGGSRIHYMELKASTSTPGSLTPKGLESITWS